MSTGDYKGKISCESREAFNFGPMTISHSFLIH